ncbi:hypothetical protein ACCO45_013573 [Purpureocillium lilacinum]|uniref:Uncharacterized protein n=1 Tax=Purpureocillium lilacinum TaxID=33203 RepID=A0ACC4D6H0_PURLI
MSPAAPPRPVARAAQTRANGQTLPPGDDARRHRCRTDTKGTPHLEQPGWLARDGGSGCIYTTGADVESSDDEVMPADTTASDSRAKSSCSKQWNQGCCEFSVQSSAARQTSDSARVSRFGDGVAFQQFNGEECWLITSLHS